MYTQKEKEKRYNDLLRATSNMFDTLDHSRLLIVETGNEEHETNNVDTDKEITVEIQDIDQNEHVTTDLSNNPIFSTHPEIYHMVSQEPNSMSSSELRVLKTEAINYFYSTRCLCTNTDSWMLSGKIHDCARRAPLREIF